MNSVGDADRSSKRQRKKKMKRIQTEHTAAEDNFDDEQIEFEIQQQIESVDVPASLPDKSVCIQIHTGKFQRQVYS